MSECECLPHCKFFNNVLEDMPSTAERTKRKFCLGENSVCARYMVYKALGSASVPPTLFPMQRERARELIMANIIITS
jgi:hypothetical protein